MVMALSTFGWTVVAIAFICIWMAYMVHDRSQAASGLTGE